ncbi:tRNA (cytidine(34)-2'-O)-methyltransferase [Candidatus Sumerlaeota bacterium]|nr:tRNA (cytidine(34)-2'-O)-methyltransferase [Candidatus Sumerlaeota bacterium]
MHIALYRPEIPPNTGNIARLCVCTGTPLHIIGKPSFSMDERAVRRAGLDYWDRLALHRHKDWEAFVNYVSEGAIREGFTCNILVISKHGGKPYWDHAFQPTDFLVFGRETDGLPDFIHQSIRAKNPDHILRIPMTETGRSLNLSNAAAIVLYEALRQTGFSGQPA